MRPFNSRPSFSFTRAFALRLFASWPAFFFNPSNRPSPAGACRPARGGDQRGLKQNRRERQ
jgi:hypothetical protein